jgi:hypothetical protein
LNDPSVLIPSESASKRPPRSADGVVLTPSSAAIEGAVATPAEVTAARGGAGPSSAARAVHPPATSAAYLEDGGRRAWQGQGASSAWAGASEADRAALSEALDATWMEWRARKASYAPGASKRPAVDAGATAGSTRDATGKPPIPFTTSPLPGTTLGVLGASLDPHGHSRIFDTPGLVVDASRQLLFDSIASQMQALAARAESARAGAGAGAGGAGRLPSKHALAKAASRAAAGVATHTNSATLGSGPASAAAHSRTVGKGGTGASRYGILVPQRRFNVSVWVRGGEGEGEGRVGACTRQRGLACGVTLWLWRR